MKEKEHCELLLAYFTHIGDREKAGVVGERLKLVSGDVEDLKEQVG